MGAEKKACCVFGHRKVPEKALNAGRAVYTERNHEMINNSDICVVYFKTDKFPSGNKNGKHDLLNIGKSGTGIAYKYAVRKNKTIINPAENN